MSCYYVTGLKTDTNCLHRWEIFLIFHKGSITMKGIKDSAHWLRVFDTYGTKTELNNTLSRTSVKIKISRLSNTTVMHFGASVIFSCF